MLKQSLHIKQLQKLSPQQIMLVRLLQLPLVSLEQKIKQELEENPALEEVNNEENQEMASGDDYGEVDDGEAKEATDVNDFDIRDYMDEDDVATYKLRSDNYAAEDESRESPLSMDPGFQDYLLSQFYLLELTAEQRTIGEVMIGNLDESGYLQRELSQLVDDLAFTFSIFTEEKALEEVLAKIQSLEPPGVGARGLKECLVLQLQRYTDAEEQQTALQILNRLFDAFVNKRYDQIMQRLNLREDQLKKAVDLITTLNPKPGSLYNDKSRNDNQTIIPDFILEETEEGFEVVLNARNTPELRISYAYSEMLQAYAGSPNKTKEQKDAIFFIKQKMDSARSFMEAIQMRHDTLLSTMQAIVQLQSAYFKEGDIRLLKPMKLQDVAELIAMDISTVSRVVNSKYVQTHFGIFSLRDFFSNSISASTGDETTSAEIKALIADIIAEEDKRSPINDDALTEVLAQKGFSLARRTVSKYRESLGIGVARLRREI